MQLSSRRKTKERLSPVSRLLALRPLAARPFVLLVILVCLFDCARFVLWHDIGDGRHLEFSWERVQGCEVAITPVLSSRAQEEEWAQFNATALLPWLREAEEEANRALAVEVAHLVCSTQNITHLVEVTMKCRLETYTMTLAQETILDATLHCTPAYAEKAKRILEMPKNRTAGQEEDEDANLGWFERKKREVQKRRNRGWPRREWMENRRMKAQGVAQKVEELENLEARKHLDDQKSPTAQETKAEAKATRGEKAGAIPEWTMPKSGTSFSSYESDSPTPDEQQRQLQLLQEEDQKKQQRNPFRGSGTRRHGRGH